MRVHSEKPLLSVIIPTLGRDECVRATLRDLKAQTERRFEVWLVDQNDPSLEDPAEGETPFRLHHEKVPPLGSHGGRNHAIERAQAELCLFIDDDVRIPPDFVASHLAAWAVASPDTGAIVGRVIQPKDEMSEETMRQTGRLARYSRWSGRVTGNFVGIQSGAIDHIHECNFSARTSVLRQVRGFNPEFRGNAYFEGADLGQRIQRAGFRIRYEPRLELTHLQEGRGGNRVHDKSEHTYWMMRNIGLLNSSHMVRIAFPIFGAWSVGYVLLKALKNRDTAVATRGLRGVLDGMRYFLPSAKCRERD